MMLFHSRLRSLSLVVYLEAMHIDFYCCTCHLIIPFGNLKESKHYYKQKSNNGYGERIVKEDVEKSAFACLLSFLFVSLTQNFLAHGEHALIVVLWKL